MFKVVRRDFFRALVPLVSAAGAVLLVRLWTDAERSKAFSVTGIVVLLVVLVAASFGVGLRYLPNKPTRARRLMEMSVVSYFLFAVLGSAAAIVVGLKLAPADDVTAEAKELAETVGAAATAFVLASVASVSHEKASATLGEHISTAFRQRYVYQGSANPDDLIRLEIAKGDTLGQPLIDAVHNLNEDWSTYSERSKRVRTIESRLASWLTDGPGT